ncbi:SPT2-like protein isoform 2 [Schistosoma japonicum]|uniref:SPT2-like protein isoform 2 n=1 Tax=Schistosoma japonicum TaxID=6182 RepID=A0A4Z2DSC7_SCHJA|nr:SPT2-like protein [Schistosoma japonicum]TNN19446.1 SPT2-like protein isoform 2 [Schistosoma japonicum]
MEFREVLALAKKKQSRHDNEVKRIEEHAKQREIEKKKQMEIADELSRKYTKHATVTNNNVNISNLGAFSSPTTLPTVKASTVRSETFSSNSSSVCKSNITAIHKVTDHEKVVKLPNRSLESPIVPCSVKRAKVPPKPSRLSFTDMMELAKKNVQHSPDRKRPFDDLIPCSVDSKYRKLDSSSTEGLRTPLVTPKITKKPKLSSKTKVPESLKVTPNLQSKISISGGTNGFCKTADRSVIEKAVQHLEKTDQVLNVLKKNERSNHTRVNLPTLLKNKAKFTEPLKTSQTYLPKENKPLPKSSVTSNLFGCNIRNKEKPLITPTSQTPNSQACDKAKVSLTKTVPKLNKDSVKSLHKSSNNIQKPLAHPQPKSINSVAHKRGIAAQLGVNLQSPAVASLSASDSTEDEYMSDDSFIDDSEALQSKEYARVVRDIHRALKFDPRRYKDVNPYEDLRCMEAKYCDIEKEERRSIFPMIVNR